MRFIEFDYPRKSAKSYCQRVAFYTSCVFNLVKHSGIVYLSRIEGFGAVNVKELSYIGNSQIFEFLMTFSLIG